jgi:hypothetical protein
MSKTYRVILIDPEARSVRELDSSATLTAIHELVGVDTLSHFTMAQHRGDGFDVGWVDDFGLYGGKPVHAFLLPIGKAPIAGRCVIVGVDRYGETCSARIPLVVLLRDVKWLGLILPEVTWDKTDRGSRAIVTYSRVK